MARRLRLPGSSQTITRGALRPFFSSRRVSGSSLQGLSGILKRNCPCSWRVAPSREPRTLRSSAAVFDAGGGAGGAGRAAGGGTGGVGCGRTTWRGTGGGEGLRGGAAAAGGVRAGGAGGPNWKVPPQRGQTSFAAPWTVCRGKVWLHVG